MFPSARHLGQDGEWFYYLILCKQGAKQDFFDSQIDHYSCEHKQWASYDPCKSQPQNKVVYNNIHCLESQSDRPLVRLLSLEELAGYNQRYLTSFEDCVECGLCALLKLSYVVLGTRKATVLHLRHV